MIDAIIISGGNIQRDFALDFLRKRKDAILAAADRGLEFCKDNNIIPDLAVGDFDSVSEELVKYFEEQKTEVIRLCPEKDDSDTQSLLNQLLGRGIKTCAILGATGTRLDHVFANLELLVYAKEKGMSASIYDKNNCITVIDKKYTLKKQEQFGKYVSLFPLGGEVKGLTLQGFYYPLTDYTLTIMDCGLTVSNEIIEEEACIQYESGTLLMLMTRD